MITVDLHLHTNYSDGKLALPDLIDLYGQAGFDAIAVTDHLCVSKRSLLGLSAKFLKFTLCEKTWKTYYDHLEKEKNRAWREYKMIVYTGLEYSHNTILHRRNAHMLAIDVKDFISPELNEADWLKAAREQGAMTVAAHPLKLKDAYSQTYYLINNADKFAPLIDAWEVANYKTFWYEMFRTPFSLIASSDFHSMPQMSAWRTKIHCDKDPEAIKHFFKSANTQREFVFIEGHVKKVQSSWPLACPITA